MLGRRQCSWVGGVDGETPDNYSGYCTSRCSSVPLMKHTSVDFSCFVLIIFVCFCFGPVVCVFFWLISCLVSFCLTRQLIHKSSKSLQDPSSLLMCCPAHPQHFGPWLQNDFDPCEVQGLAWKSSIFGNTLNLETLFGSLGSFTCRVCAYTFQEWFFWSRSEKSRESLAVWVLVIQQVLFH